MSEQEKLDLQQAETVCRRFLAWNLEPDSGVYDVKEKLRQILGLDSKKESDDEDEEWHHAIKGENTVD